MIAANGHDAGSSEIAHALASAVTAAVDAARAGERGTHSIAWTAAAGVADLLELKGLVALLAACEKHANAPPLTVSHVLERLARLAAETESAGRTAPFVAADRELEALAGMIHSQEWTAPTPADPTRTRPLARPPPDPPRRSPPSRNRRPAV